MARLSWASYFCTSVYMYRWNYFFWLRMTACQQTLSHSFWMLRFRVRFHLIIVIPFYAAVNQLSTFPLMMTNLAKSGIRKVRKDKLLDKSNCFSDENFNISAPGGWGASTKKTAFYWFDAPEFYAHTLPVDEIDSSYFRFRQHNAVGVRQSFCSISLPIHWADNRKPWFSFALFQEVRQASQTIYLQIVGRYPRVKGWLFRTAEYNDQNTTSMYA